jgi:hypothetical protein
VTVVKTVRERTASLSGSPRLGDPQGTWDLEDNFCKSLSPGAVCLSVHPASWLELFLIEDGGGVPQ